MMLYHLLGAAEEVTMETHKEEMELLSNSMAAYAHIRGGCVNGGLGKPWWITSQS